MHIQFFKVLAYLTFLTIYLLKMQTLRLFLFYLRHFRPGDLRSNTHLSETTFVIFIQIIQN